MPIYFYVLLVHNTEQFCRTPKVYKLVEILRRRPSSTATVVTVGIIHYCSLPSEYSPETKPASARLRTIRGRPSAARKPK